MTKAILAIFMFFFSSCATHNMMVVDTSYLEGCQNGAYATFAGIKNSMGVSASNLEINQVVIATLCQSMYLETLRIKNPKYEQIKLEDQSIPQI